MTVKELAEAYEALGRLQYLDTAVNGKAKDTTIVRNALVALERELFEAGLDAKENYWEL